MRRYTFIEGWLAVTREIVERAQASGEIVSTLDADRVARLLVTSFIGTATLADIEPERAGLISDLQSGLTMTLESVVVPEHLPRARNLLEARFKAQSAPV